MDFKLDPRTVLPGAAHAPQGIKNRQLTRLKESTQELEVNFLNEMLKAMRKNVPEGELFKKNSAEKLYEEMQDTELARAMSSTHKFGLADAMYRQMAPLIENRVYDTPAITPEKDTLVKNPKTTSDTSSL